MVAGKQVILCLDEAQAIPIESLEALRLLTNLETEKRKLLQIVLFGQPELNRHLEVDSIRQLAQRITFHYHMGALQRDDLDFYLAHRLRVAGFTGSRLFTQAAVKRLFSASKGIPRLVNIVAHKSLMLAYGEGRQQVDKKHVAMAAQDTVGNTAPAGRAGRGSGVGWPWLVAAAGMLMAAGSMAWAVWK